MDVNEQQGRWLLERGAIDRELVSAAWAATRSGAGPDLCAVLVARGELSEAQARHVRSKTGTPGDAARDSGAFPILAAEGGIRCSGVFSVPTTESATLEGSPTSGEALQTFNMAETRHPGRSARSGERSPSSSDAELTVQGGLNPLASGSEIAVVGSGGSRAAISATGRSGGSGFGFMALVARSGSLEGMRFAQYEVVKELGRGGMGIVLLGRQGEAEVVIKVMLSEEPDPTAVSRFQLEARALAKFRHPNIVRVRGYGEEEGCPYFVMDRVHGRDLKERVDEEFNGESVPAVDWTTRVLAGVAKALAVCHAEGVIHRDLKPANVLVEDGTERPVLVDFGLVKRDPAKLKETMESIGGELTKTGEVLGTPAYMAPEQLDDSGRFGELSEKADVWGFGATLFYVLTGQAPYVGATAINIYKQLMTKEAPRASSLRSGVPDWLDGLCASCLQKQPGLRPTMAQVAAALEAANLEQIGHVPRKPLPSWVRGIGVALLLVALGLVGKLLSVDRVPPVLRLQRNKITSATESVVLKGKLREEHPAWLRVGSKILRLRESGLFRFELNFPPGRHELKVVAIDELGNESEPQSLTVIVDVSAPELTLERVSDSLPLCLEGTLNEDGCKLSLLLVAGVGEAQTRKLRGEAEVKGRHFRVILEAAGKGRSRKRQAGVLFFRLRDAVGHERLMRAGVHLVGRSGTQFSFPAALGVVAAGERIILTKDEKLPEPVSITKPLTIVGFGAPTLTITTQSGLNIRLRKRRGRVSIEGLKLCHNKELLRGLKKGSKEYRRAQGETTLIKLEQGELALGDCVFSILLGSGLLVQDESRAAGRKSGRGDAHAIVERCRFGRLDAQAGILLRQASAEIRDCIISDDRVGVSQSTYEHDDCWEGSVSALDGAVVEIRGGSFTNYRDRALLLKNGSRAVVKGTKFNSKEKNGFELVLVQESRASLEGCVLTGAAQQAIEAEKGSHVEIAGCEILDASDEAIAATRSTVTVRGTVILRSGFKSGAWTGPEHQAGVRASEGGKITVSGGAIKDGDNYAATASGSGVVILRGTELSGNAKGHSGHWRRKCSESCRSPLHIWDSKGLQVRAFGPKEGGGVRVE